MLSKSRGHYPFYYLLAAFALLRLLVAPQFGLGVDEAHYLLYGRYLELSYFDHPPLVGWVQYLFISLFGETEFAARLGAVIIGALTLWMLYFFVYALTKESRLALISALALSGSFMFNALFLMLMPDTLLFLVIIPILYATLRLSHENTARNWLVLGLLLGIAGLSKYTAVLFLIPIILFFAIKKRYHLFYTPKMFVGIAAALLLISPVIIWNMQNGWISFTYQSEHVVGASTLNWRGFAQSAAAQFIAYSPLLSPIAFYGLYRSLRSKDETLFLSGLFGLTLILFFSYAALYKTALPHWSALFYLLFIPLGSMLLWQKSRAWKNYVNAAIGISIFITLLLYAELALKFIPQPDYHSLHRDIYGFERVMQEANALVSDTDKEAIAVTHWSIASRTLFYNSGYSSDVYLIDTRYDQFDIWQNGSPLGRDLLFINTHDFNTDVGQKMQCQSVQKVKSMDIILHNNKVNTIEYVWCREFQGVKK